MTFLDNGLKISPTALERYTLQSSDLNGLFKLAYKPQKVVLNHLKNKFVKQI